MDRNYAADMRQVIDSETSHGPYTSAVVAAHIVEKLRATDVDLLNGWLQEQAVQFVRVAINERDHSRRAHARGTAGRSVFREMADAAEAGDPTALGSWLATVFVIEDGSRVRLGEMREPELVWAAGEYDRRARDNQLQAAFLSALARKVGDDRVSDHFDDDQLSRLWNSITAR